MPDNAEKRPEMSPFKLISDYPHPQFKPANGPAIPLAGQAPPMKPPVKAPPAAPNPGDDEFLRRLEKLLLNEKRLKEVEEENRVLTRSISRLQIENDQLRAGK